MAYFLVAVSTRTNLDLCLRHSLAGFTGSGNGFWSFVDIEEGDYISFLHGAKAFNLYQVSGKCAYLDADTLPPWPPVVFEASKRSYYFPFRIQLRIVRQFEESLVRSEFAYVAENLLLRGGYRKTHFQADQTTLSAASELGRTSEASGEVLDLTNAVELVPRIASNRSEASPPEVFGIQELLVQAMIRQHLSVPHNLSKVLDWAGVDEIDVGTAEVLGEKALPEGHVDPAPVSRTVCFLDDHAASAAAVNRRS